MYFHAQTHTQEYRCPKRPEASEPLEPRLQVVLSFPSVGARNCILQFSAGAASPPNPQAISLASKLRYLKERLVVSPFDYLTIFFFFDYLTIKTMVSKKLDFPSLRKSLVVPDASQRKFVSRKQSLSVLNSSDHRAESRDWSTDKERTTPCPGPPSYAYLLSCI